MYILCNIQTYMCFKYVLAAQSWFWFLRCELSLLCPEENPSLTQQAASLPPSSCLSLKTFLPTAVSTTLPGPRPDRVISLLRQFLVVHCPQPHRWKCGPRSGGSPRSSFLSMTREAQKLRASVWKLYRHLTLPCYPSMWWANQYKVPPSSQGESPVAQTPHCY